MTGPTTQADRLTRMETILVNVEATLAEMRDDLKKNYVTKEMLELVRQNMDLKFEALEREKQTESKYSAPWWVLVSIALTAAMSVYTLLTRGG